MYVQPMTGRMLMISLLLFAALFGAGLWYAQVHAFYEETEAGAVTVAGETYPVTDWRGIDATSSPLKLRACFRLAPDDAAAIAARESYAAATPLVAPPWFECFDAGRLTADIADGTATAHMAAAEEEPGAHRVIAVYPDGRAYQWRQLTEQYADQ